MAQIHFFQKLCLSLLRNPATGNLEAKGMVKGNLEMVILFNAVLNTLPAPTLILMGCTVLSSPE